MWTVRLRSDFMRFDFPPELLFCKVDEPTSDFPLGRLFNKFVEARSSTASTTSSGVSFAGIRSPADSK